MGLPDCSRTQRVMRGYALMATHGPAEDRRAYKKIALSIRDAIENFGETKKAYFWRCYENLASDIAEFSDKPAAMQALRVLHEDMTTGKGALSGNVVHIFEEAILETAAMRESFLRRWLALSTEARKGGIEGTLKIAQSLNGRYNVKSIDYLTRVTETLADNHKSVRKLEGGLTAAFTDFRGLDFIANAPIDLDKLPTSQMWSGHGTFLTAELKSGYNQGLEVEQGMEHLTQLFAAKHDPRLFRFVHNSKEAAHEAKEAEKFLNRIKNATPSVSGKAVSNQQLAARKVMQDLESAVPGIKNWTGGELKLWYTDSANKKAADRAIATMQKWFYVNFKVGGYGN